MRSLGLTAAALAAVLAVGAACSPAPATGDLSVVTSSTVLADLVAQVGGDRASVSALVPRGGDVHTFDPSASQATEVSQADLIVVNGMGLDDWITPFAQQVGASDTPTVELAVDLPGVDYIDNNPHLWMNVQYAARYVERIRAKLVELDPAGADAYNANASRYQAQLTTLDDWVRGQLATIPAADRRVVSFHDAFPYFGAAYDLEMVGVLVDAPGQDPSPAQLATLIQGIRDSSVKAILAEAQFGDQLAQTIADETGAIVVSDLYTDSLGDPPVDSYEGAMRWNVDQITQALR
jgi:manganese/iron transport system substrate-binding protein